MIESRNSAPTAAAAAAAKAHLVSRKERRGNGNIVSGKFSGSSRSTARDSAHSQLDVEFFFS